MAKVPAEGKKVVVRRLPPGMTADEFWSIIGNDWKVGNGKVDWARYDDGEIAEDASDHSQPAACYLHILKLDYINTLAEVVQQAKWEDAKQTINDPALIGPPCLDVAPNQKIPTGKKRTDPRQGTIDSDPEFMKFLESLTAPVQTKEAAAEQTTEDGGKTDAKATTTPLVEYIREKKANKAKEAALAKSAKHARHESQTKAKEDNKKKGKESKSEKADKSPEKEKEKAKEPIKLLTKKAAAQEAAEAAKATAAQNASSSKAAEEAAPKSRRANIAAAAKILQRDLGLSPGSAHRKARQDAAKAGTTAKVDTPRDSKETESKAASSSTSVAANQTAAAASASSTTPTAPKAQLAEGSKRNRGGKGTKQNAAGGTGKGKETESSTTGKAPPMATPVILKRKEETPTTTEASTSNPPTSATASTSAPPTGPKAITTGKAAAKQAPSNQKKGSAVPSLPPGATRAFVKHANPSQGVTEPLLKQAMEVYGPVTFVEIDKRKGFAYVDFRDHDGLVKAMTASPVTVAQGTVQVLERKETKKVAQTPATTAASTPTSTQPAGDNKANEAAPDRAKRGGRGRGRRGGGNADNAGGKADATSSTATAREAKTNTSASGG